MAQRFTPIVIVIIALLLSALPTGAAPDNGFAPECVNAADLATPTVGVVDCVRLPSDMLGATTAFSYYVPPACDPALGRECPVLYYLHGTGGSYREGLGGKGSAGSAWVRALTSGPPVDVRAEAEPWRWANPTTWVPQSTLDLILVAPHGLTLPGGNGPGPHQNPFWMDWNPRYAQGGDTPRYDTPPPRFESHVIQELIPFVDQSFPTSAARDQRAIVGYSMGGNGAFHIGLKHPDLFASMGMRSGPTLPSPVLAGADQPAADLVSIAPPADLAADLGHQRLPGVVAGNAPSQAWEQLYGSQATVGYGDAAADHVWWRHNQPADLASNARAWRGTQQSVHLQYFVNDAIPRRTEDLTQPNVFSQFFETAIYPTNLWLEDVFTRLGIARTFHIGPGDHSATYGQPYFREQLEGQYAHLRHADGGGNPGPRPDRFDYRTIRTNFDIWGWRVAIDRAALEFLDLTDVTCDGLSARGSGTVTITVPARCHTGVDGSRTVVVDLGPSQPVDEPAGASTSQAYGRTVHVELTALHPRGRS